MGKREREMEGGKGGRGTNMIEYARKIEQMREEGEIKVKFIYFLFLFYKLLKYYVNC